MDSNPVSIGDLRWQVELAGRSQIPDPNTTGTLTLIKPFAKVWANIEPVGAAAYLNGMQLETGMGLTHRAFIRWRNFDDVSIFTCIIRRLFIPVGTGSGPRVELYHVLRASEWNGRHRFLMIELQLEKFVNQYQIAAYS